MTTDDLGSILAAVQDRVPYLRSSTSAPADDGWIGCADLLGDRDRLAGLITTTGAGRGTDDPAVAASLFTQAYAFRVAGIAVAAHALGLAGPATDAPSTAIQIARHRPSAVAYLAPTPRPHDPARLAADLFDGHVASLIAAVRDVATVGERLLWGNVATSCAVAFRAVDGASDGDHTTIRDRADRFFDAASPWLEGLGGFVFVDGPAQPGWFWERTNCCLWYQASGGSMCDDCSLTDPVERRATWRTQLEESTR